MKPKRQQVLAAALILTIAMSARLALHDRSTVQIVLPAEKNDAAAKTGRQALVRQQAGSPNSMRDPLLEARSDPFKGVNFAAPVQAAAVAPALVPAVEPKPVAPQFPYRYFGRMVDVHGQTLTFLSKEGSLVPIRTGSVLDEVYRIDTMTDKQISLTYLPLNEQISISMQSAAE